MQREITVNEIELELDENIQELMEGDIVENLLKSEEDIKNGRVFKAEDVFKELRIEYEY